MNSTDKTGNLIKSLLAVSLLFLVPGLIISLWKPESAGGVSGLGYIFLLIVWIINLITLRGEKQ